MSEIELLETPIKSESDKKDYRLFQLNKNKLRVLLISDPVQGTGGSEKLAAASLCIDVGAFHDSNIGVPGMAHFVEHMVFMGSKKYPDENAYDKYITSMGGRYNATTHHSYTFFYFEITEKGFEGAVDRLSNFFVAPLMLKDSMNRERNAVESEFQNGYNNDRARLDQLYSSMTNSNHPGHAFPWGNLKTLKETIDDDDLYARAHKFHAKHYVANKMFLCLQSKLKLDELQDLAVKYFSDVPYKADIDPPLSANPKFGYLHAFRPDFYEKMFYMKPKSDQIKLIISWILPSVLDKYRTKPQQFIAHILGHEGPGSLCSYLRNKFLAVEVMVGTSNLIFDNNPLYALFSISITLTDNGLANMDQILDAVFSYLLLLQKSGANETLFQELKKIKENSFKFSEEKKSIINVNKLSTKMLYFAPKDVLTGADLYFDFDKEQILEVIETLNQPKFNLMVLTEKHEFDKKEKWFDTEYAEVEIPDKYKRMWLNRSLKEELHLPEKNPFICSNFQIFYDPKSGEKVPEFPEKIFENECCETWYRLDDKFLLPKALIYGSLISPEPLKSNYSYTMLELMSLILQHYLAEVLYPAEIAGLNLEFNTSLRGLFFTASGFNEKLPLLIEIFMKKLKKFSEYLEESAFETYKKQLKKDCYNFFIESHKFNAELRTSVIQQNFRTRFDVYQEVDKVKFGDLKEFSVKFLEKMQIQLLIQGNMKKEHCLEITDGILKNLQCQEIKDKSLVAKRARKIAVGNNYLRVKSLLPGNKNSTTTNYYQIGEKSIKLNCLLDIFTLIQHEPVFNILRTQQQLGYGVNGLARDNSNLLGFSVTIMSQEDKNPTNLCDERIEDFLTKKLDEIIEKMTEEEFETTKQSLIKLRTMMDTDLKTEVNRNWSEITIQDYLFDRRQKEVKILESLKKSDVVEFYNRHIKIENPQKISVQVVGSLEEPAVSGNKDQPLQLEMLTDKLHDNQTVVSDLLEFKQSLYVYPALKTKGD